MTHLINKFSLALIVISLGIGVVNAASIKQMQVDEMLQSAGFIFEGRVTQSEARWNDARSAINTHITFEITDIIHGSYANSSVELSFAGGSLDDLTMQVHGMVYPQVGEQGIYFVEELGKTFVNPIVGWSQGHFLIRKDVNGKQRMTTAQNQPIVDMKGNPTPAVAISEGVASGIRTYSSNAPLQNGMSKQLFKQALKDKLLILRSR